MLGFITRAGLFIVLLRVSIAVMKLCDQKQIWEENVLVLLFLFWFTLSVSFLETGSLSVTLDALEFTP